MVSLQAIKIKRYSTRLYQIKWEFTLIFFRLCTYAIINLRFWHTFPDQPESHSHPACNPFWSSIHLLFEQTALHIPWPLQCSLINPGPVEHAHRLQALSQSFDFKKSLQDAPKFSNWMEQFKGASSIHAFSHPSDVTVINFFVRSKSTRMKIVNVIRSLLRILNQWML